MNAFPRKYKATQLRGRILADMTNRFSSRLINVLKGLYNIVVLIVVFSWTHFKPVVSGIIIILY